MRLFFAVDLTDIARQEVSALQEPLRAACADVKWIEPENLHLTLKFFGEVREERLPELQQAAREAAASTSPFPIYLEGVGAFPGTRHPRVIWVGVGEGKQPLEALARTLEQACERLGFPPEERPFSAHLTIGRSRSGSEPLTAPPFKTSEPIRVDRLVLFQSKLSPHGPIYTPLAEIPLGG